MEKEHLQELFDKTKHNLKVVRDLNKLADIDVEKLPKILVDDPLAISLSLNHGDVIYVDGEYLFVF